MTLSWYKATPQKLDNITEEKGIYILSVQLNSGEYGVIYVGQSENLRKRAKEHFSPNESNLELRAYLKHNYIFKISYAKCSRSLNAVEKYLILHFKPKFNNNEGNGTEMEKTNLPNVVKYEK